jgi:hypothetical protein
VSILQRRQGIKADNTNSVQRNQELSPLLRLPGELRNRIYGYVHDGQALTIPGDMPSLAPDSPASPTTLEDYRDIRLRLRKALLCAQVCRQISNESSLLPFTNGHLQDQQFQKLRILAVRSNYSPTRRYCYYCYTSPSPSLPYGLLYFPNPTCRPCSPVCR